MKLLLVDDEEYAREGLVARIDWDSLGITEIMTARNGIDGLKKAGDFEPDIVVTDVRMPKMDGIQMAFRIRQLYPECSILFMSGYSDKEYLKAAISVSAVSYVEKPINIEEMRKELQNACQIQEERMAAARRKEDLDGKLSAGLEALKNQIALNLTRKIRTMAEVEEKRKIACPNLPVDADYRTFLIQLAGRLQEDKGNPPERIENPWFQLASILTEGLHGRGLDCIAGYKDEHYLVIHVCLGTDHSREVAGSTDRLTAWFEHILSSDYRYYLAVGSRVSGLSGIYESYHDAVVRMQQSFFFPPDKTFGDLIAVSPEKKVVFRFGDEDLKEFQEKLFYGNFEEAVAFIGDVVSKIREKPETLVFHVKEFFYRCMLRMLDAASRRRILAFETVTESMVHDQIWDAGYLSELETYLIDSLQLYFENVSEENGKPAVSDEVKYYVSRHYGEMDLSLASIADKLKLTSSYLCIVFKKECQVTLTQYIMEYRVARAKELLADETMKIKDIAFLTGYQNSNYFIKVFKKIEGVTPLEYRSKKEEKGRI